MTLQRLLATYGGQWIIADAAGGGWYAVRRLNLNSHQKAQALSIVRCGLNLDELARHLDEENQKDKRPLRARG